MCRLVEGGLERGLREGVLNRDLPLLQQTLRTHASLGSTAHAHKLIRTLIRKEVQEVRRWREEGGGKREKEGGRRENKR